MASTQLKKQTKRLIYILGRNNDVLVPQLFNVIKI